MQGCSSLTLSSARKARNYPDSASPTATYVHGGQVYVSYSVLPPSSPENKNQRVELTVFMASNTKIQSLHLRPNEVQPPPKPRIPRHTGILQDQLRRYFISSSSYQSINSIDGFPRSARRPWNPDFSTAVRILLLIRVAAAMYSNIQDCDEGMSHSSFTTSFSHISH